MGNFYKNLLQVKIFINSLLNENKYKKFVTNATFLLIFVLQRLVLRRVHFTFSNFAWGLHGGVDVKCLEACLFWSCIDVIVVRIKVSRGTEPFSPMKTDIADSIPEK